MDQSTKIAYWLDISRYDLDTAKATFQSARYLHTAFMCQQAVEKMLKAVFLALSCGEEPPRTHNLLYLLDLLGQDPMPEELTRTCSRLTAYYIETRYPDYKEKLSKLVDYDEAQRIFRKTKEVISWLESLLPSNWR